MISENKAVYDYGADMKKNKWSGNIKLKKVDLSELPDYIKLKSEKYKDWLN